MARLTQVLFIVLLAALTLLIMVITAALETGKYKIKGQNRFIGRMRDEVRDLSQKDILPKKIYSLKDSSQQVVWFVRVLDSPPGSDKYSLENGGAPVIAQENLAYAALYLDENVPDTTRLLNADSGERQYTISVPYKDSFLTEPRACNQQVTLALTSGDSTQIWTFMPVEDDNSPQ